MTSGSGMRSIGLDPHAYLTRQQTVPMPRHFYGDRDDELLTKCKLLPLIPSPYTYSQPNQYEGKQHAQGKNTFQTHPILHGMGTVPVSHHHDTADNYREF